ncbi:MAG TPA: shikimate dehydrogenase [Acidimicrobiia bacterium]|nr:shikimate dehydrogenase [Acidimicrobiia bacterium]
MSELMRLAVLGDPVAHSRSPAIHQAAMRHLGIEGRYEAIRAGSAQLADAVAELRSGALHGINVTMPLKEEAARLADDLTDEAFRSGSVNTLRARDERVEGHSTDVIAIRLALADQRFEASAPILLLGSGGAAAAALVGMAGRSVFLSARRPERAAALAGRVGTEVGFLRFGTGLAGAVVVNATPLGMRGETLPENIVGPASGVIDLAYGDAPTPTVQRARESGLAVMDGTEFLVLQAAASFRWWTGMTPPTEVMLEAARKT